MTMNERLVRIGLVLLPGLALLIIATLLAPSTMRWDRLDLSVYEHAATALFEGRRPYRDFGLEYPPFALAAVAVPRLLTFNLRLTGDGYAGVFGLVNVLYTTGIAALLAWIVRERQLAAQWAALLTYTLLVAVLAPLLPWRYDLFPALFTAGALVAVQRERPLLAGLLLGLAIAAKLYPVVLVAAVAVYYLARRDWRATAWLMGGSVSAVAAVLLPFALLAPGQMFSFLAYHQARGLQIESVAGSWVVLANALHWSRGQIRFDHGALHLQAPLATALLPWLLPLFVGLTAGALWLWYRQFRREYEHTGGVRFERLVACMLSMLLIFLATNKVFSPQYLIWLLPFVPLVTNGQRVLFVVIAALTIALFPFYYDQLLAFELAPVLILNARNLLVIAALPWLLSRPLALRSHAQPARPAAEQI